MFAEGSSRVIFTTVLLTLVFNLFLKKGNHTLVVVQCHTSSLG